jgi:hypothetical protein
MPRKGNIPPTPCPSEQAYRRHLYHGEEPCDGCVQAHRDHTTSKNPARSVTGVHVGKLPLGPGECGTERGYRWHHKIGETPCGACKDAHSAGVRARYGKATGTNKGYAVQPCGTPAAYQRHLRHGETPCEPCTTANTAYKTADRKAQRILAAMNREAAN